MAASRVPEAPLQESGSGLAPTGPGWFVVNVGDAMWLTTEGGEKKRSGVGAGDEPCAILMVGSRSGDWAVRYPVSELAAGHGASVESETSDPDEAYAQWEPSRRERPSTWERLPWA